MPPPVTWLGRLPQIISQVETVEQVTFDRRWLELLFNLQRTAAAKLLRQIPGAFPAGNTFMIHRRELLLWLYKLESRGSWRQDAGRLARVARVITEGRETIAQRQPIVEVPKKTVTFGLDEMPPDVHLERTKLQIDFNGFEDLFTKLFTLAQIIANDELRIRTYLES